MTARRWSTWSRKSCRTPPCPSASGWADRHSRGGGNPISNRNNAMNHSPSRRALLQALAASFAARSVPRVLAQADGTLRLVVTSPPGGSTDTTARIIQPELQKRVGRPVVVENKPGAASQVGTEYVARAKPDGNTLLVCFDTHAINPIVKKNLPYDTFRDFVGVSLAVRFPLVIGANPSAPGKDLKEFLAAASQEPG